MSDMKLIEAILIFEDKLKKGKKHFIYDSGLCDNLATIGKKFYQQQIKDIVVNWKHFSGDLTYPIGGKDVYNHHKALETLWVGDQLKLRKDLIKFIKESFKEKFGGNKSNS